MDEIIGKLKNSRNKALFLELKNGNTIKAGIYHIDESINSVKIVNKKGLDELMALQLRGNILGQEETAILENPNNFSVIPISHIKDIVDK